MPLTTQPNTSFLGGLAPNSPSNAQNAPTSPVASQTAQTTTLGGLDPQAVALTKAIRQTESQGNFQATGKSGEYGAYQFEQPTWDAYSKEAGVNVPLQQATPEQQNQVAYTKIKSWKDAGYNPGQIASMWNAGPGKPNAYLTGNAGTNQFGAQYDTQAYAQKVATYYQQFKQQGTQAGVNQPAPQQGSFLQQLGGLANQAVNFAAPVVGDIGAALQGKTDKSALQIAGDVGQTALTAAAFIPGLGPEALAGKLGLAGEEGLGLAGRIGANAALGSGFGVTGALSQGQTDPGTIAQSGALGAGLGGALGGLGEAGASILGKTESGGLPNKIIEDTVPLRRGTLESDAAFTNRTNIVVNQIKSYSSPTVGGMIREGQAAASDLNSQIDAKIAGVSGSVSPEEFMSKVSSEYPNASQLYTPQYIQDKLTTVVPQQSDLISKLFKDGLSLPEANTLKKSLYANSRVSRVFKGMVPAEAADIGATASLNLADLIKSKAPGTSQLFSQESKHIRAVQALDSMSRKKASQFVGKSDVLASLGGFMFGGAPGAIATELGKKTLESPTVRLGGARLLSRLGQIPVPSQVGQASKVAALRAMLGGVGGQSTQPTSQ